MRLRAAYRVSVHEQAAEWLSGRGYRVLERGFSSRSTEIDLVAFEGAVLCFVVLCRDSTGRCRKGGSAVNRARQRRLCRTAVLFMARRHLERHRCRFDVVGVPAGPESGSFMLFRDAFPFAL